MNAYDSNAVTLDACRVPRPWARSAAPSSWVGRTGICHAGEARALRAW